jgi:hypothetical protein
MCTPVDTTLLNNHRASSSLLMSTARGSELRLADVGKEVELLIVI